MTYQDQYDLSQDTSFQHRLSAGLASEAKGRDTTTGLPAMVLRNPTQGSQIFMPFISTEPGYDAAYAEGGQESITDPMLLSGIQANWDAVETIYFAPADPPAAP